MKLLALVQKPLGLSPGQRFRLEQWAPHLEAQHDITVDFAIFESPALTEVLYQPGRFAEKGWLLARDAVRRAEIVPLARKYDGVIVYREAMPLGPAVYERVLARLGVPLYHDFDDAIWISNVASVNGLFSHLRFANKTASICRLSRAVSVGNAYLAEYAREFNERVAIVRTSIELADYPIQPRPRSNDPIVVGWTGSRPTLTHLELARPFLEKLATRRQVRLRVICSEPPRPFRGVELDFRSWSATREAEDLGGLHAGIMPLSDDDFAKGKCACKALQFMAVGCPVVVSPIGMNTELIVDRENGILANGDDEWIAAIEHLADDTQTADAMGAAGRRTVEESFSAVRSAARFAELVRSA